MSKLSERPSANFAPTSANLTVPCPGPLSSASELSSDHRRTLLHVAHQAILSVLERQPFPHPSADDASVLLETRGVFTTLYLHGQLRGCVGYAIPVAPLYRAVAETARAAAFEDSRFVPVTLEEAVQLQVSLSVLSRLFRIHSDAVEVGHHGLLISDGTRRGLLLPQVPAEHGWDRATFLEQTCRKAGLPLDAWRKSATIEAFTAEVFSDADLDVRG